MVWPTLGSRTAEEQNTSNTDGGRTHFECAEDARVSHAGVSTQQAEVASERIQMPQHLCTTSHSHDSHVVATRASVFVTAETCGALRKNHNCTKFLPFPPLPIHYLFPPSPFPFPPFPFSIPRPLSFVSPKSSQEVWESAVRSPSGGGGVASNCCKILQLHKCADRTAQTRARTVRQDKPCSRQEPTFVQTTGKPHPHSEQTTPTPHYFSRGVTPHYTFRNVVWCGVAGLRTKAGT